MSDTLAAPCQTFGKRLRSLRLSAGLTQRELGALLGHIPSRDGRHAHRVTSWEIGTAHPRLCDLPALAKALHTSTDFLLGA